MRIITALWFAMLAFVPAATNDPGDTALRFLEKVRDQDLNLEPGGDTALAEQTRDLKRREIARRLERMARELDDTPLEVGEVKLDGDLAAVLIHKSGGLDPNRMRVFPIALVRSADTWKPAPLPASFENTGLGYSSALRRRIESLKEWMLHGQVTELARLRDQSTRKIREKIEESLPVSTLAGLDPRQTAERFISACGRRNLPEVLGLIGGLCASPPSDWTLRLGAAEKALAINHTPHPWRLLVSADVLRAIVHHEEDADSALVSLACLDPAGKSTPGSAPEIELIHLELSKSSDAFWRIDLPEEFLNGTVGTDSSDNDSLDQDLLDAFANKLAETYPPSPRPDARQAAQDLADTLQDGGLHDVIRLIAPVEPPSKARAHLLRAAQAWWTLRDSASSQRLIGLDTREDGSQAVALAQIFSSRNPDRFDLRSFHFSKSENGWLWSPLPEATAAASLDEWTRAETQRRQQSWKDDLLVDCIKIAVLPESGAPTEAKTRALVESWLKAAREGDVRAALRLCARLDKPDSQSAVLRNLGYEITGLQRASRLPAITATLRDDIWSCAAVSSIAEENPAFPLYTVLQTPDGPRILIEVDLIASTSRSRDFLNRAALDRLQDHSPAAAASLKRLFGTHDAARKENKTR